MFSRYCHLAFVSLAGLAIGLPVSGKEYIPTKGGEGRAKKPRLILARGDGIDLSFDWEGAFGGGQGSLKVGVEVPFSSKLGLHFGSHKLQEGDRLCGPSHDGKYFLLKKGNSVACRRPVQKPTIYFPNVKMSRGSSSSTADLYLPSCKFTLNESKTEDGKKSWKVILKECWSHQWQIHKKGMGYSPLPEATVDLEYAIE